MSFPQREEAAPVSDEAALPSDCRFREDLMYLGKGDLQGASEWKNTLEQKQRYDAKLRKESGKHK